MKIVQWYDSQCPKVQGKKRGGFTQLQYQEYLRQEQSLLMDSVGEMMSELHFVTWMAKPKNGCMDPMAASALWNEKRLPPCALTDELDPNPKMHNSCMHQRG